MKETPRVILAVDMMSIWYEWNGISKPLILTLEVLRQYLTFCHLSLRDLLVETDSDSTSIRTLLVK